MQSSPGPFDAPDFTFLTSDGQRVALSSTFLGAHSSYFQDKSFLLSTHTCPTERSCKVTETEGEIHVWLRYLAGTAAGVLEDVRLEDLSVSVPICSKYGCDLALKHAQQLLRFKALSSDLFQNEAIDPSNALTYFVLGSILDEPQVKYLSAVQCKGLSTEFIMESPGLPVESRLRLLAFLRCRDEHCRRLIKSAVVPNHRCISVNTKPESQVWLAIYHRAIDQPEDLIHAMRRTFWAYEASLRKKCRNCGTFELEKVLSRIEEDVDILCSKMVLASRLSLFVSILTNAQ